MTDSRRERAGARDRKPSFRGTIMRTTHPLLCVGLFGVLSLAACSTDPHHTLVNGTGGSGASTGNGGNGTGTGGGAGSGNGTGGTVGVDDPSCTSFTPSRPNLFSPEDPSVSGYMQQMSQNDKIGLLSGGPTSACGADGYSCDFDATGVAALGIPDMPMRDGPRGVHQLSGGQSTTWAVAEARAASFDLDLEYRVGKAQGEEMLAFKYEVSLAPVVNTLRHPRWGRAQETYGEDPVLVGEMGAAFTRGLQLNAIACPKHFVNNDTENNRGGGSGPGVMVTVDEQTLRENYTRPFEIIVKKADPGCIMAAYNGVNGQTCTANQHLLTDILRTDWGWNGFVVSDWWATQYDAPGTLNAGLDLEMPDNRTFQALPSALSTGTVTLSRIEEAGRRILNVRAKSGKLAAAYENLPANPGITGDQTHRDLAAETEEKGAVLLKNDGILPLGSAATVAGFGTPSVTRIVVLGPDRNVPTTGVNVTSPPSGLGDRGSSNTTPPYAVSFVQGITARAGTGVTVTASNTISDAANADVVVIPVTMGWDDEGEGYGDGHDRQDMTLAGAHPSHWTTKPSTFIQQVAAVNPNIVVLLAVGSAIVMEDWIGSAKAVIQTFYPGQEGGTALAKLLFGDLNFSGKLPFTVATTEADYPAFQNGGATATADYYHGYRKIEHDGKTPRFWFGYGMSYTKYQYSNLKVLCSSVSASGRLNVQVNVKNTGNLDGDEVVQLYVAYPNTAAPRRAPKELKAFTRVSLKAGEAKDVQLTVPASDLAYWDTGKAAWVVEKVVHKVLVGPSADPAQLQSADFSVD